MNPKCALLKNCIVYHMYLSKSELELALDVYVDSFLTTEATQDKPSRLNSDVVIFVSVKGQRVRK